MRSDYIAKVATCTLDANGNGTATVKPDVGQYWTPFFLRVATNSQNPPFAYCAVYQGAVGIQAGTTFIDDTYMGNGDTSSIIAGTVAQFGEAISATWSGGNPGDVATLTVYGSSQDTPPAVSDMPTTPGTHFSGKKTEQAIHIDGGGQNLASGGEVKGPVINARPWASYYLTVFAQRNAAATAYNGITARVVWFSDPSGSVPIYADVYEIYALRTSGNFQTQGGKLFGQDILHGPYMQIVINNLGADSVDINYELLGTTRSLPGPYFREMSAGLPPDTRVPDNFVINPEYGNVGVIAPGATFALPGLMRYGRAHWRLSTDQSSQLTFFAGSMQTIEFFGQLYAAGTVESDIILPKRSTLIKIKNVSGVNMNAFFNMISENEKV